MIIVFVPQDDGVNVFESEMENISEEVLDIGAYLESNLTNGVQLEEE